MNLQADAAVPVYQLWLDGTDGQEDELEDVQKGMLEPSTDPDDEMPGDIVESNKVDPELEKEMEEGNA